MNQIAHDRLHDFLHETTGPVKIDTKRMESHIFLICGERELSLFRDKYTVSDVGAMLIDYKRTQIK